MQERPKFLGAEGAPQAHVLGGKIPAAVCAVVKKRAVDKQKQQHHGMKIAHWPTTQGWSCGGCKGFEGRILLDDPVLALNKSWFCEGCILPSPCIPMQPAG
eukprot:1153223-Pelagomonas_calceolata.AAC.11